VVSDPRADGERGGKGVEPPQRRMIGNDCKARQALEIAVELELEDGTTLTLFKPSEEVPSVISSITKPLHLHINCPHRLRLRSL
jgi:hypothetical protein